MKSPNEVWPGYAFLTATTPAPSDGIFIPRPELNERSEIEVPPEKLDPATGDIRVLIYAFIDAINTIYSGATPENKLVDLTITKRVTVPTGNAGQSKLRSTFTLTCDTISPSREFTAS